jgi:glutathione S-transferase
MATNGLANGHSNGESNSSNPSITLYTSHYCPWAHRAHIILSELGLPYKEEIIDLTVPRHPDYLAINPRGLVPTLVYDGEIITESAIVVQFLADAHPSHLVKTSSEPGGALQRARINFFVDAFISKVNPHFFAGVRAANEEEREEEGKALVAAVVKEVEPLLKDAAPFFGGSKRFTLAEVLTGSFVLRNLTHSKYGLHAKDLLSELEAQAPNFYKWANAVINEKSVTYVWNEKAVIEATKAKLAKLRVGSK